MHWGGSNAANSGLGSQESMLELPQMGHRHTVYGLPGKTQLEIVLRHWAQGSSSQEVPYINGCGVSGPQELVNAPVLILACEQHPGGTVSLR